MECPMSQKFKFDPGRIVATPGAIDLRDNGVNIIHYLKRHLSGDWGDLCEEDVKENEFSLANGFRLLSCYKTKHGDLWIITEYDRSATTLLLPSEY
jgi:hypothetical protein